MNYLDQLESLRHYAVHRVSAAASDSYQFLVVFDPSRAHLSVHMLVGEQGTFVDCGNTTVSVRPSARGITMTVQLSCTFCEEISSVYYAKSEAFSVISRIAETWHGRVDGLVFEP